MTIFASEKRSIRVDGGRERNDRPKASRVLIYGINYAPEPIGVGKYTGELGAFLVSRGHQVDVVTAVPHYPGWRLRGGFRNHYQKEVVNGANVIRCPIWLGQHVHGIWRLIAPLSFALTSGLVAAWQILVRRPDTVLCVEPTLFCAPVALLAARLVGAKTVLHVQDLEVDAAFATGHLQEGFSAKFARYFEKVTLAGFDSVVTISGRMRDKLHSKGIAKHNLSIVRNWVDLSKFRSSDTGANYRAELGLNEHDFIVLYSGNLGIKQGLNVLLDAARELKNIPEIKFVIAGDGPEKDRLVEQYSDLTNVRFVPLQPEHRLSAFLKFPNLHVLPQERGAADLVLPSKLGGMLASQKPCIVMADAGTELHDFLGSCARVLPPGDATQLAMAIDAEMIGNSRYQAKDRESRLSLLDSFQNLLAFEAILLQGDFAQTSRLVNKREPVSPR